jgi:hypothetical protein
MTGSEHFYSTDKNVKYRGSIYPFPERQFIAFLSLRKQSQIYGLLFFFPHKSDKKTKTIFKKKKFWTKIYFGN